MGQSSSRHVAWMRFFGVLYLLGAAAFFLLPSAVFGVINGLGALLGIGEPLPPSTEYFWLALATSMMVMLSMLCFLSAREPKTLEHAWRFAAKALTILPPPTCP